MPEIAVGQSSSNPFLELVSRVLLEKNAKNEPEIDYAKFLEGEEIDNIISPKWNFELDHLSEASESEDNILLRKHKRQTTRNISIDILVTEAAISASKRLSSIRSFSDFISFKTPKKRRRQSRNAISKSFSKQRMQMLENEGIKQSIYDINEITTELHSVSGLELKMLIDIFLRIVVAIKKLKPTKYSWRRKSCEGHYFGVKSSKENRLALRTEPSPHDILYQDESKKRTKSKLSWYLRKNTRRGAFCSLEKVFTRIATKKVILPSPQVLSNKASLFGYRKLETLKKPPPSRSRKKIVSRMYEKTATIYDMNTFKVIVKILISPILFKKQNGVSALTEFRRKRRLKSIIQVSKIESLRRFKKGAAFILRIINPLFEEINDENTKLLVEEDMKFLRFLKDLESKKDLIDIMEEKKKAKQKEAFLNEILSDILMAVQIGETDSKSTIEEFNDFAVEKLRFLTDLEPKSSRASSSSRKYALIDDINRLSRTQALVSHGIMLIDEIPDHILESVFNEEFRSPAFNLIRDDLKNKTHKKMATKKKPALRINKTKSMRTRSIGNGVLISSLLSSRLSVNNVEKLSSERKERVCQKRSRKISIVTSQMDRLSKKIGNKVLGRRISTDALFPYLQPIIYKTQKY